MVDIHSIAISDEALRLIPKKTAVELSVLPLGTADRNTLTVGITSTNFQLIRDLEFLLGIQVVPTVIPSEQLIPAIQRAYKVTEAEMQQMRSSNTQLDARSETVSEKEEGRAVPNPSSGSAITLASAIISDAIRMGASDIHIEPYEDTLRVRYRLDGVLQEAHRPLQDKTKALISRLKIMADLDIAEKRRPQDGRIRVKEDSRMIDIRVSTLPTDFGEKIVLRILDRSQLKLDLSLLGFDESDLEEFRRVLTLPYGMILVTGPTGSGKTTTLYAALNHINRPTINITTIEDPIEYNLHGINQTHVRSDIGLTFAAALRSILRQDPNVIMVGEIRDAETAEIAIRASLTGHLVFSTLHTNDAPSAIERLIDMGIPPFLVASSVKMILAQRLLRRICPECKHELLPTQDTAQDRSGVDQKMFQGKGCGNCRQSGYRGRIAIYEMLNVDSLMSSLIAKGSSGSELRTEAGKRGMRSLRSVGLSKVQEGITTLEEVLRETIAEEE